MSSCAAGLGGGTLTVLCRVRMGAGGPYAGNVDLSKYQGQAGFGSSDVYGEGADIGGNSMFDAGWSRLVHH